MLYCKSSIAGKILNLSFASHAQFPCTEHYTNAVRQGCAEFMSSLLPFNFRTSGFESMSRGIVDLCFVLMGAGHLRHSMAGSAFHKAHSIACAVLIKLVRRMPELTPEVLKILVTHIMGNINAGTYSSQLQFFSVFMPVVVHSRM